MAWYQLNPLTYGDHWDATLVQSVADNIAYIVANDHAHTYGTLNTISINYDTAETSHKAKLNALEENIDKLFVGLAEDVTITPIRYYNSAVTYDYYYPTLEQVNRWINFTNYYKEKLGI